VSVGPKTGSSLLADMFSVATNSIVRENLMCADMFEAGVSSWERLSSSEQIDSQSAYQELVKTLSLASLGIFTNNLIAKTTTLSHIDTLKTYIPNLNCLYITRDWQSSSRSLYGFTKKSSILSKNAYMTPNDCVRYVRSKFFKLKSSITPQCAVISYLEILELMADADKRQTKFEEWQKLFPFLNIDCSKLNNFIVSDKLQLNRSGTHLLDFNELSEINECIKIYETKDKLDRQLTS
jgi:hypothetical protein